MLAVGAMCMRTPALTQLRAMDTVVKRNHCIAGEPLQDLLDCSAMVSRLHWTQT